MQDPGRDRLAREHMDLVEKLVGFMRKRFGPTADPEEIRSFAMVGLASAIDNYDDARGVPFEAYAALKIKGAIYDGLAASGWFPRRLYRQIAFYRKLDEMSEAAADDPPPTDRIEAAHRLADRLKELATAYVTTHAAPGDSEKAASPASAELSLERKEYHGMVRAYLTTLPERQQTIVREFFFEDRQLKDIAADLGVSKSWVSRLLSVALARLRDSFGETPSPLGQTPPG